MLKFPETERGIVNRSPNTHFRYHGCPSVAIDEEGTLYAVDSGFRVSHVCPFGKTCLYRSRDGGRTFTPIYADWHGTATWERTLRCFTQKGNDLYIVEFERPGLSLTLPDMPRLQKGTAVTLLGTTGIIKWRQKKDGTLTLDLSRLDLKELNALDHAWVFKIENGGRPATEKSQNK